MVDLHNRIESRPGLGGSGMSADPEKIVEIKNQWEQGVRTYGQKNKVKFKQVIEANLGDKAERIEQSEKSSKTDENIQQEELKSQDKEIQPQMHWVRV